MSGVAGPVISIFEKGQGTPADRDPIPIDLVEIFIALQHRTTACVLSKSSTPDLPWTAFLSHQRHHVHGRLCRPTSPSPQIVHPLPQRYLKVNPD